MNSLRRDDGFTLVELLVVMALLSVITVGFYSVMFSGSRGASTAQDLSRISQEARLGFNRMVRDARQAGVLDAASPTSFTVRVDADGDGAYSVPDFEVVTYTYVDSTDRITISNGVVTQPLIEGVEQIGATPVFSYSSNLLEYDANNDGTTTEAELEAARLAGATLTVDKLRYFTSITFQFRVRSGDRSADFYTQAQLRNFRS
jgi:prepilin-type N-terminal cleavage/methylation domain-containing protein